MEGNKIDLSVLGALLAAVVGVGFGHIKCKKRQPPNGGYRLFLHSYIVTLK